jgi:ParB family chromosome partitioning protein
MIVEVCETRGIIINMPINELHDFPSHPYKLHEGSEMESLKASIQAEGVHTPLLVWHTPEQGYTVISVHRRLYACRALGIETVPAIIHDITWVEAAKMVVDSNLNREKLLPSEIAYAYKLRVDALRHQGRRTDLITSDQNDRMSDKESAAQVARDCNKSVSFVRRYIRLTHLLPDLLQMVDSNHLVKMVGVHLSHLSAEEQQWMLDIMRTYNCKPSVKQAEAIKAQSKAGTLTRAYIIALLTDPAEQDITQIAIDDLRSYFPVGCTNSEIYSTVIRLCQDQTNSHQAE